MTKTLPKPNFRNQLRGMLQRHSDTVAVPPNPAPDLAATASPVTLPSARLRMVPVPPVAAIPAPVAIDKITPEDPPPARQPVEAPPPTPPMEPHPLNRFSVRLEDSEMESLNRIIVGGIQGLGERITASDIFRVGLSRVGKGAPISPEEISALRKTDRRRFKPNHVQAATAV